MTNFRIKRILPDGAVVVQPGWSWGGCSGVRVRPMTATPTLLKRGGLIELREGVSIDGGCLLCEVVPHQGERTCAYPNPRGPLSTGLTLQPTI